VRLPDRYYKYIKMETKTKRKQRGFMPRGRPSGSRNRTKMKKQESPTQVIDEKVAQLLAVLGNCGREQLFDPKTDCDYCPVRKLCHRVWNNSGYEGMEEKLNVIMKLKHGEPVDDEMMKLVNSYEHNKEKPRKGVKHAVEA